MKKYSLLVVVVISSVIGLGSFGCGNDSGGNHGKVSPKNGHAQITGTRGLPTESDGSVTVTSSLHNVSRHPGSRASSRAQTKSRSEKSKLSSQPSLTLNAADLIKNKSKRLSPKHAAATGTGGAVVQPARTTGAAAPGVTTVVPPVVGQHNRPSSTTLPPGSGSVSGSVPIQSPSPSPPAHVVYPPPEPESEVPTGLVDSTEIVDFSDEFDDGVGPDHLRVLPDPPAVTTSPIVHNEIGAAIEVLIVLVAAADPTDVGLILGIRNQIMINLINVLAPLLDRNDDGRFFSNIDHMEFWRSSKGPEFLQFVSQNADCGVNVVNDFSEKTNCYLLMMLATNIPLIQNNPDDGGVGGDSNLKPRDVARHIGLDQFCERNKAGIAVEIKNRARDPDVINYWWPFDANLPRNITTSREVLEQSFEKSFSATWLSHCPVVVKELESADRIMVFRHAVFRMQYATLNSGGQVDTGIDIQHANRETLFEDAAGDVDILGTNRIQKLRLPISDIRFGALGTDEHLAHGLGVKHNWALTIGKQIFKEESDDTTTTIPIERKLFLRGNAGMSFRLNNQIMEANEQNPVLQRNYKAAGRYVGYSIINRYQIPEDLSVMFYAKLMGRRISWKGLKIYDREEFVRIGTCMRADPMPDACSYLPQALLFKNPEDDMVHNWGSSRKSVFNDAVSNYVTHDVANTYKMFTDGIFEVVPKHIFECGITTRDLRSILVGELSVDPNDMIAHLSYGGYNATSPQTHFFINIIRSFNQTQLQDFLEFVTSSRRAPAGGFQTKPIRLDSPWNGTHDPQRFPNAHTCFSSLEFPAYPNEHTFRNKLETAMASDGSFSIA